MKDTGKLSTLLLLIAVSLHTPIADAGSVSESLLLELKESGTINAIVELEPVIDSVLSTLEKTLLLSAEAKIDLFIKLMTEATTAAQAPIIAAIKKFGFTGIFEGFWLSNSIFIQGLTLPLAEMLSKFEGTFTLRVEVKVKLEEPMLGMTPRAADGTPEWGVDKIEAPAIWKSTTTGKGILVAGIDTGVMRDHETLSSNYANGWLDVINKNNSKPYDDNGHGTHTMGTVLGQKGIGVAPGAKWIACKGLSKDGGGSEAGLIQCAQFILKFKPTPNVVCNSWGGAGNNTFFNEVIKGWQAAGIIPVFAIGNAGSNCSSAGSPGDQPNVISVGAVDQAGNIASFSSRGPGKVTKLMKPEVSAPGVNIKSAFIPNINSYTALQGTSMACPHVAGAVALMLSAKKDLKFLDILRILEGTAAKHTPTEKDLACDKENGGKNWPNNAYGHGRISAKRAVEMALKQ